MKIRERTWLEALESMANYFYEETGDPYYLKLRQSARKKLGIKNEKN